MDEPKPAKQFFDITPPATAQSAPLLPSKKRQMITVADEPAVTEVNDAVLPPTDQDDKETSESFAPIKVVEPLIPEVEPVVAAVEPKQPTPKKAAAKTKKAEPEPMSPVEVAEPEPTQSAEVLQPEPEPTPDPVAPPEVTTEPAAEEEVATTPATPEIKPELPAVNPLPTEPEASETPKPAEPEDKDVPLPEPFGATDALPDAATSDTKDAMETPKIYDTTAYHVPINETHHSHGGLRGAFVFGSIFAVIVVAAAVYILTKLGS